jgi:hypothetical protein
MILTVDTIMEVPAKEAPTIDDVWRGLMSSRTFQQMQIKISASPRLRNETERLFKLKDVYQLDAKLCNSMYVSVDESDSKGCPKYSFESPQITREDVKRVI